MITIRQSNTPTATFIAPAIRCGGCADNVRAFLSRHPGVRNVDVAVESKQVSVAYDAAETSPERIALALTEAGYPPATAGT
jgi:copper chaperone CopZ